MKMVDEDLLDSLRGPGRCEVCKRWCKKREPHHLSAKGQGGAMRIDHPWNLLAVGDSKTFQCDCHTRIHSGEISREYLHEIMTLREWETWDTMEAEIKRLQRQSKEERRREMEATST